MGGFRDAKSFKNKKGSNNKQDTVPKVADDKKKQGAVPDKKEGDKNKEAAEKAAEEQRKKEAAEKAAEEQRKKEAAEKAAEEQRKKEAAEKAAEEQRKKEAAEKVEDKKVTPEMIEKILSRVKNLEVKYKDLEETDKVVADAYEHFLDLLLYNDGKIDKLSDLLLKFVSDTRNSVDLKVLGGDGDGLIHADGGLQN